MGLTLDVDHQFVYWIVRNTDGATLFKAQMANSKSYHSKINFEKINMLENSNLEGPLCYFSHRLFWLQDDKTAVISNLDGQYIAKIKGKKLLNIKMIQIIDSGLQLRPSK